MPPPAKNKIGGDAEHRHSDTVAADDPSDGTSVIDGESSVHEDASGNASELDTAAQALIGHQLRTLYSEIVREPVPDQLLKLLQDLERKERE